MELNRVHAMDQLVGNSGKVETYRIAMAFGISSEDRMTKVMV